MLTKRIRVHMEQTWGLDSDLLGGGRAETETWLVAVNPDGRVALIRPKLTESGLITVTEAAT
jgi:hypothetical protein